MHIVVPIRHTRPIAWGKSLWDMHCIISNTRDYYSTWHPYLKVAELVSGNLVQPELRKVISIQPSFIYWPKQQNMDQNNKLHFLAFSCPKKLVYFAK